MYLPHVSWYTYRQRYIHITFDEIRLHTAAISANLSAVAIFFILNSPTYLKLLVDDEQVSSLVELECIAKDKCAVTRTERVVEAENLVTNDFIEYTHTVLELKPLCEYP